MCVLHLGHEELQKKDLQQRNKFVPADDADPWLDEPRLSYPKSGNVICTPCPGRRGADIRLDRQSAERTFPSLHPLCSSCELRKLHAQCRGTGFKCG